VTTTFEHDVTVILLGQVSVSTGGSNIVTVKLQLVVSPQLSVTLQVTVLVVPAMKLLPLGGEKVTEYGAQPLTIVTA
jgi:hypothetical protein